MASPLLYIYDSTVDGWGGLEDYGDDGPVTRIGADKDSTLFTKLDAVVASGQTFDRVLWATHGDPGQIRFGDDLKWSPEVWKGYYWRKGAYHRLFPRFTSMWFSGCNVGEDDVGLRFLAAAGSTLLRAGGMVKGWDSYGLRGFDGTIRHWWGSQRYAWIGPGGHVLQRGEIDDNPYRAGMMMRPPV